jgi:hypothetical protein
MAVLGRKAVFRARARDRSRGPAGWAQDGHCSLARKRLGRVPPSEDECGHPFSMNSRNGSTHGLGIGKRVGGHTASAPMETRRRDLNHRLIMRQLTNV